MRLLPLAFSFFLMAACGDKRETGTPDDTVGDADTDTDTDTDTDADADSDTDTDTDSDTDPLTLTATSAEGVTAEVTVTKEMAEAAGVALEDVQLEFLDDEGVLYGDEAARELAGAVLGLSPGGLSFPMPLELTLTWPDSTLADGDNPDLVFVARCREGHWQPQAITAAASDSLTILVGDTDPDCGEMEFAPPMPFFSGAVYSLGLAAGWVNTVALGESTEIAGGGLVPNAPLSIEIEGWLPAGTDLAIVSDSYEARLSVPLATSSLRWEPTLGPAGSYTLTVSLGLLDLWSQSLVAGMDTTAGADVQALARAFAPIFEFAPDEAHFPVPLDGSYFARGVELTLPLGSQRSFWIDEGDALDTLAVRGQDEAILQGGASIAASGSLEDTTVYVSAHDLTDGGLALQYWTFFEQDPRDPGSITGIAAHNRDRESTVVVLDPTGALVEVIYAGHGDEHQMRPASEWWDQGWEGAVRVPAADVARECEHPVVFVAEGSHAQYPRAGTWEVGISWATTHFNEDAGGGYRADPPGFNGAVGYDLRFLPASSELSWQADMRHLLFSGYWVDGLGGESSTFPPDMRRYADVDGWRSGLEAHEAATVYDFTAGACTDESETDCADGLDGDGDGLVDCDDPDCYRFAGCDVVTDHEGISMVLIPAGTFTMGSPSSEVGREFNETQHEVTLTGGFYLGVYEVTQAQFEGFMGYQPSYSPDCDDCPAEGMNWYEAAAFANAVSVSAGLAECYACLGSGSSVTCNLDSAYATPYDCSGYRLPTEAEWEYAARAGTTHAFSNGGNLYSDDAGDCDGACCWITAPTWTTSRGTAATTPRIPSRWARRIRTPGACTTCTATSGSGATTGGMTTRAMPLTRGETVAAPSACIAAAPIALSR